MRPALQLPDDIAACLFDLDGVLTRTAELHASAWKEVFDEVLQHRATDAGEPQAPFDLHHDYNAYVDGRPRADGIRAFLAARGIALVEGAPDESPSADTVRSIGRRKNDLVQRLMTQRGVAPYAGSVRFLAAVGEAGLLRAVVTSSENASAVLHAAGLDGLFDVQVDGAVAHDLGLAGKPAPDVFLEAARRLNVAPSRAAVFEDALAGVAAGRAGHFGLVVGVDRGGDADGLRAAGADVVVKDLDELLTGR